MSRNALLKKLAGGSIEEAVRVWEETEDDNTAQAIERTAIETWGLDAWTEATR